MDNSFAFEGNNINGSSLQDNFENIFSNIDDQTPFSLTGSQYQTGFPLTGLDDINTPPSTDALNISEPRAGFNTMGAINDIAQENGQGFQDLLVSAPFFDIPMDSTTSAQQYRFTEAHPSVSSSIQSTPFDNSSPMENYGAVFNQTQQELPGTSTELFRRGSTSMLVPPKKSSPKVTTLSPGLDAVSAQTKPVETRGRKRRSGPKSKNSLDSRLSLVRLGEVLNTSSLAETIEIEKFVLDIFENTLGFPMGRRTWIRDTSDEYREKMLNALHELVAPTYPKMTRSLLETVIKRATYSMMQGRLRKERRAASKQAKKQMSKADKKTSTKNENKVTTTENPEVEQEEHMEDSLEDLVVSLDDLPSFEYDYEVDGPSL